MIPTIFLAIVFVILVFQLGLVFHENEFPARVIIPLLFCTFGLILTGLSYLPPH